MQSSRDELARDLQVKRMLGQLEHTILETNKTMIGKVLGSVGSEDFEAVAVTVARIRTLYLQQVMRLKEFATTEPLENIDSLSELLVNLRRIRNAYDEATAGFTALQHALERDYMTIQKADNTTST